MPDALSDLREQPDAPWSAFHSDRWRRIQAHDFEPPCVLNFTARLARDKGWHLDFARGAIAEYRRFCFLAVSCPKAATPSEEVDEVWHQHLTYSRDYWTVWCPLALGAPLHHEPTQGGRAAQDRFRHQYAATLARYERFFGPPPEQFWPATHRRFARKPRFRTIDAWRHLTVPHPLSLFRRPA